MRFTYKIQKPDGTVAEGEREALSREMLLEALRAEGGNPLMVKERPSRRVSFAALFSFSFVPLREKVAFSKNLAAMLGAGLPLSRALEVLIRQSGSRAFQKVLVAILADVRKGTALSEAMRAFPRVFPPLFPAVVAAGEESGTLSGSFTSLTEQTERMYTLGRKFRGALAYPILIALVMAAVAVLMLIYVVPELSATFAEFGVALPASTRVLIGVSAFLHDHLVLSVGLLCALFAAVLAAARTRLGGRMLDWCALRLPLIKTLSRELNAARTARTLGSLSASGVPLTLSLAVAADVVQNAYYQDALRAMRGILEKGKTLSFSFEEARSLYDPYLAEMIASGEETGKLSGMLMEAALFYEGEVEQKTKNFSSIIEPFLMVAVGVAVGFFAYAMILPLYTVMNAL